MAYIVADPCVLCKHTDCVAVCPVDCFYEGVNMLVIHPDECIDCGACEPECPVEAIFEESDLPAKWQIYVGINALYSGAKEIDEIETDGWPQALRETTDVWPNITEQKEALPEAEANAKVENKLSKLDPKGFEG